MDVNLIVDSPFRPLPRGDRNAPALSINGTQWWTWTDLRNRRDRFVRVLRGAGVGPGDRVGMVLLNSLDYVALYFAVARLGAIAVRLNFRLAPAELAFLIEDSGASVVVFHSSRTAQLEPIHADLAVRSWLCLPDDDTPPPEWADEPDLTDAYDDVDALPRPAGGDPVMIMYTSGTTGRPKGAVWTHDNVLWFATIQAMQWGFTSDTVTLTTGPLYHAGAFECFTLPALLVYGRAVVMSSGGMSAERIAGTIGAAQVTDALLYPFLIYELLELDTACSRGLDSLRLIMSGGDPLPAWAVEKLENRLPGVVLNKGFGLTEGGAQSAVLEREFARTHPDSVGRPLPLTEIRVEGADGSDAAPDEIGEIWVRSPAVSGVYWNRPEATRETFVDGWCRTGDLGRVTPDGLLVVSGRDKDMIRSGGENIYPAEIEAALSRHGGVDAVAVVGVPDPKYIEVGCAVVVPGADAGPAGALEAELRELCAAALARYKAPRYYVFVDELPRNPAGKVLKRTLRDRYAAGTPVRSWPRTGRRPTMRFGDIDVRPVLDGVGREDPNHILTRPDVDDPWSAKADALDGAGHLDFDIGGFLIRSGERTVVVDTGVGTVDDKLLDHGGRYTGGRFLDSLRAHGVTPDDVTDVLLTHLHFDHVGWATQQGRVVFPRATYRAHRLDWEHFVQSPDASPGAVRKLSPLAGQLELFDDDRTVAPGVDAVHSPGHTPGSTVFVVSGGGRRGYLLGDVVHSTVELEERDWRAIFDEEPELASKTRNALADEIAATGDAVAGAHFPGLEFGHLTMVSGKRRFRSG